MQVAVAVAEPDVKLQRLAEPQCPVQCRTAPAPDPSAEAPPMSRQRLAASATSAAVGSRHVTRRSRLGRRGSTWSPPRSPRVPSGARRRPSRSRRTCWITCFGDRLQANDLVDATRPTRAASASRSATPPANPVSTSQSDTPADGQEKMRQIGLAVLAPPLASTHPHRLCRGRPSSGAQCARTAKPSWVSNADSNSASGSILASLSPFSNALTVGRR